jgi:hypothetical protein
MNADDMVRLVVAGRTRRALRVGHMSISKSEMSACGLERVGRRGVAAPGLIRVSSTPIWCTAGNSSDSIRALACGSRWGKREEHGQKS